MSVKLKNGSDIEVGMLVQWNNVSRLPFLVVGIKGTDVTVRSGERDTTFHFSSYPVTPFVQIEMPDSVWELL